VAGSLAVAALLLGLGCQPVGGLHDIDDTQPPADTGDPCAGADEDGIITMGWDDCAPGDDPEDCVTMAEVLEWMREGEATATWADVVTDSFTGTTTVHTTAEASGDPRTMCGSTYVSLSVSVTFTTTDGAFAEESGASGSYYRGGDGADAFFHREPEELQGSYDAGHTATVRLGWSADGSHSGRVTLSGYDGNMPMEWDVLEWP